MNDKTRQEMLVHQADQVRERLLLVVDELDRKRHDLAHPVRTLRRQLPPPIAIAVLGAAALITVGTVGYFVTHRIAKRRRARRVVLHAPGKPTFWSEVGTRTARALISFALIEAGKLAIRRAAQSVQPPQSSF